MEEFSPERDFSAQEPSKTPDEFLDDLFGSEQARSPEASRANPSQLASEVGGTALNGEQEWRCSPYASRGRRWARKPFTRKTAIHPKHKE